jgi:hypothetical protein
VILFILMLEATAYVFVRKKNSYEHGPVLNGYGVVGDFLLLVFALSYTACWQLRLAFSEIWIIQRSV